MGLCVILAGGMVVANAGVKTGLRRILAKLEFCVLQVDIIIDNALTNLMQDKIKSFD